MIDVHCHLEQKDYENDREEIIEKCKESGLKAIITSCAHPKDFNLTMELVRRHKGFVFATAGLHPEYIKDVDEKGRKEFVQKIIENRNMLVGIGEVGLDYFWVREWTWRDRQKKMFKEFIDLAKKLKLPLVIHARDAYENVVEILERENAKDVLLHMFGANHLVKRVVGNGWYVSVNTILFRSKKHKKVVRDMPLEKLMLETDSPWLGPAGKRNDPTSVKIVAEKIAEIKRTTLEEVWKKCGDNAIEFFRLKF